MTDLCGATLTRGENVHRCDDRPGHDTPHTCACWLRWVDDTQEQPR